MEKEKENEKINPVKKIPLGIRMKSYEKESTIPPENAFIVRLDGKKFSSFCKVFKKPGKPFDQRFTLAMK